MSNLPSGMQTRPLAEPLTNYLPMWVVCDRPLDYPNGFVGRMHVASAVEHGPTDRAVFGATLNEVRQQLPRGLVNIGRQTGDELQIVEVWL